MKEKFQNYIQNLQLSITSELEKVDGKSKFSNIKWQRKGGGGGVTKIIENGDVFEKGGVNLEQLTELAQKTIEPDQISGKQELYEMLINKHIQ